MPRKTNPLDPILNTDPMTGDQMKEIMDKLTGIMRSHFDDPNVYVSQTDLAKKLGTSQSRLCNWLGSDQVPHRVALTMRLMLESAKRLKKRAKK